MIYLEYYHWMANDWFITHQSLHKNKREKNHPGGEGNGLKFQCPFLWAIDGFELMYLQLEL